MVFIITIGIDLYFTYYIAFMSWRGVAVYLRLFFNSFG